MKRSFKLTMARKAFHAKQGLTTSLAIGFTSLKALEHPSRAPSIPKHTINPKRVEPDPRTIGSQAELKAR